MAGSSAIHLFKFWVHGDASTDASILIVDTYQPSGTNPLSSILGYWWGSWVAAPGSAVFLRFQSEGMSSLAIVDTYQLSGPYPVS